MLIYAGMPTRDVLNFLREEYGITTIGKTKNTLANLFSQRAYGLSKKRMVRSVKIDDQMKILELQWMLSESEQTPVVFSSDFIRSIPASWNFDQFVQRSKVLSDGKLSDKKQLLLSLISVAETFADVDWIIRIAKKNRLHYDESEEKAVFETMANGLRFLSEDNKVKLFESLVKR